ncbi:hypothetical protein [Salmonella phage PLL1]|uniref:Uncharacterized protein n=7 Tax=Kuttervirus TaxID=2169536 RepID=A0A1W5PUF4_9CAUD|nr:hypothetical protein CBA120_gp173 [Escherichia phage Cba120]YP_009283784.1 hypothetical protein BI169_gp201 [Salmonella phage GG32]YP_009877777.1 hypothetical protein HYP23_gp204 [Salmonella phage SP1]YP_009879590.1 hypothetical protein HYP54_gp208 [Escherichia phage FEC14]YP_009883099.1 hypothetical protein HYP88_gp010 [Salmonella phage SS9]APD18273.1 hypothetical protein STP07_006 [Salmonella phage STP07]QEI24119.1 hypothetical protein [Salmonella phage SS3]QMV34163.1 hypothetical prote
MKNIWVVISNRIRASWEGRMVSIKNGSHPKTYDRYDPALGLHAE